MPLPFTKRWSENRKYRTILNAAITTFGAQYKLLSIAGRNLETTNGINLRALAYLNGFLKSAMNNQKLDVCNANAFGVFSLLYREIWGKESGRRYLEFWLNAIDEANQRDVEEGTELGALDFQYSANTGKQPMGWLSCFSDKESTLR
jgi:hypothetical protein